MKDTHFQSVIVVVRPMIALLSHERTSESATLVLRYTQQGRLMRHQYLALVLASKHSGGLRPCLQAFVGSKCYRAWLLNRPLIGASLSEPHTYVKLGDFVLLLFLSYVIPYNAPRSILACFVEILWVYKASNFSLCASWALLRVQAFEIYRRRGKNDNSERE